MAWKRILVNADDFGRHACINRAVEEGVTDGILRSATLMAGGAAFADAVVRAHRLHALGVGIHFTLVNGNPVLAADVIPSLVTDEGVFYADYGTFVKRFLAGKVRMEEVRAELGAQLEKIEMTGLSLTHADSHQHLHVLPGILDAVLDLMKESGIPAMRVPRAPLFAGEFGGIGQLVGRMGLSLLAARAARAAKHRGIACPDHFAGIVAGEAVSESEMDRIIADLAAGTTEVMIHPGTDTERLSRECAWEHDFEAELCAVCSTKIKERLAEVGAEAVNFRALSDSGHETKGI